MKRLILATGLLAALAAPAYAADTALILWNGLSVETATGFGSAELIGSNLGGVTITLSSVKRTTGPNDLTEGNINIDNTTSTVETLHIIAGANGFVGPSGGFDLTGTIGVTSGKADLTGSYYVDGTNTLNGQSEIVVGTDIQNFDSLLLTGPKSFSFNGVGSDFVSGPYGLAEELTLTLQPGAAIFVQGVSMTSVPEIPAWAMILAGFGLLGLVGRAKRAPLAA